MVPNGEGRESLRRHGGCSIDPAMDLRSSSNHFVEGALGLGATEMAVTEMAGNIPSLGKRDFLFGTSN